MSDTGAVLVSAGTYDVAADDTVGALTLTNATISGAFTLTPSSVTLGTTTTALISAKLGGSGALTKNSGSGTTVLSGANTYTGGTSITAGTVSVTGSLADTGAVTIVGGTYDVAASDTVGAVTFSNGSLVSGVGTLTGASYTFINTGAGTITSTVSVKLAGSGALNKTSSSGTSVLAGANTYSGGTTFTTGRLQLNNASGLGTGTVTQGGGVTLELNLAGTNTVGNTFAPITPGGVVVSGNTIASAATPTILNTAGNNTISSNLTHANSTGGNGFSLGSSARLPDDRGQHFQPFELA